MLGPGGSVRPFDRRRLQSGSRLLGIVGQTSLLEVIGVLRTSKAGVELTRELAARYALVFGATDLFPPDQAGSLVASMINNGMPPEVDRAGDAPSPTLDLLVVGSVDLGDQIPVVLGTLIQLHTLGNRALTGPGGPTGPAETDRTGLRPWRQRFQIGPADAGVLAGHPNHLVIPDHVLTTTDLLGRSPVVRSIATWLGAATPTGPGTARPWLETELLVVDRRLSVWVAVALVAGGRYAWYVVPDGDDGLQGRVRIATAAEFGRNLRNHGDGQPVAAAVSDLPRSRTIGLVEATPFAESVSAPADHSLINDGPAAGSGSVRYLVVDDGRAVGVVPSIIDGAGFVYGPDSGTGAAAPAPETGSEPPADSIWLSTGDAPARFPLDPPPVEAPDEPASVPISSTSPTPPAPTPIQPFDRPPSADGPPMTPPGPVRQTMFAGGPTTVAPREEAEISITISGSSARPSASRASASLLADPGRTINLEVRPVGAVQVVGRYRAEVQVQAAGRSVTETFVIRGGDTGAGSVVVTAFQGSEDLAMLEMPILVTGGPSAPPQTTTADLVVSDRVRWRNQLRLYRDGQDRMLCELEIPAVGLLLRDRFALPLTARSQIASTLESIESLWAPTNSHNQALDAHLLGLGRQVRKHFIPDKIAQQLWDHRRVIESLEVVSDEPYVPWELCTMESPGHEIDESMPFLGQRGMTRRWPTSRSAKSLMIRPDRRYVTAPRYEEVDDQLPSSRYESEMMVNRFSARLTADDLGGFQHAVSGKDYDLLHFAGHGWAGYGDDNTVGSAMLLLSDSMFVGDRPDVGFSPPMIGRRTVSDTGGGAAPSPAPLVFLNACRTGHLHAGLGGFAVGFMEAGYGAFVGSQWAIEDQPAADFAETFYHLLLEQDSTTLAEAANGARNARGPRWSANFLSYVVYGNPDAVVVVS